MFKELLLPVFIINSLYLTALANKEEIQENNQEAPKKEQELTDIDFSLFKDEFIIKEDLKECDSLIKKPQKEIIFSDSVGIRNNGMSLPNIHEKNQQKFIEGMRKTDRIIKHNISQKNSKNIVPLGNWPFNR